MCEDAIVLKNPIPQVDDFTDYLESTSEEVKRLPALAKVAPNENLLAYDFDAVIKSSRNGPPQPKKPEGQPTGTAEEQARKPSRVHACSCFKGSQWSLTIRQKKEDWMLPPPACPPIIRRESKFAAGSEVKQKDEFLNSFKETCDTLYRLIFRPGEKKTATTGLVIVTGGTSCGKSQIIRGLIDKFLCDEDNLKAWFSRPRVPHFITYEDPIEQLLFGEDHPLFEENASWINYTPRQRGIDVSSLSSAIKSALRQTPAAFYVGEVRDIREWKLLLEFAGTGHLIFTTAHAGSLVEAMGKLFAATSSETAVRRAIVADRLAALVHLRTDRIEVGEGKNACRRNIVIPSLWRRTMVGAKTLMAEGQSSLLPHTGDGSRPPKENSDQSCFGRACFSNELMKSARKRLQKAIPQKSIRDQFEKAITLRCTEWDLEGL